MASYQVTFVLLGLRIKIKIIKHYVIFIHKNKIHIGEIYYGSYSNKRPYSQKLPPPLNVKQNPVVMYTIWWLKKLLQ